MASGYAFGSGGYAAGAGGTRTVQSPRISPLGIVIDTGAPSTDSPGPQVGEGTASPQAQGVSGRAALANDLSSNLGVANMALNAMGQLGGPVASMAMTGLKAAMTAHNAVALAQAFENMTPSQRAEITTDQAFALSNPPALAQALAGLFGQSLAFADPMGQKESAAFQSQRAGERGYATNRADEAPPAPDTSGPPGVPGAESGTGAGGGPGPGGGGSNPSGEGVGGPDGYSKGGYVKDRVPGRGDNEPALLAGGEFVIRRQVVARHRKLLEHINAKAR